MRPTKPEPHPDRSLQSQARLAFLTVSQISGGMSARRCLSLSLTLTCLLMCALPASVRAAAPFWPADSAVAKAAIPAPARAAAPARRHQSVARLTRPTPARIAPRRRCRGCRTGAALLMPAGAIGPAVSQPNGKLSVFGGVRDRQVVRPDSKGGLMGSWTMPLGHEYGVQLDGLIGRRDGALKGGAGVHLFWRDPGRGALGITGSWVGWDADRQQGGYTDMFRVGGAGELYSDRLTLAGQVGAQLSDNIDNGFYGRADLKWYPTPNLAFKLGGEWNKLVRGFGRLGLEYQPGIAAMPGLALFADAAAGDNGYYKVFVGLRVYFGSVKSLKDRHRRDDPENTLAASAAQLGRARAPTVVASGGDKVTPPPTVEPPPPPPVEPPPPPPVAPPPPPPPVEPPPPPPVEPPPPPPPPPPVAPPPPPPVEPPPVEPPPPPVRPCPEGTTRANPDNPFSPCIS